MNDENKRLYEEWIEFARNTEVELGLSELRKTSPELVLEKLSNRLTNKMLYPIIKLLENRELNMNYEPEQSVKSYKENYLKKYDPKADHVVDE